MPGTGAEQQNLSIQGYNLVTILKRLEAATSRLEDVTVFQENLAEKEKAVNRSQTTSDADSSPVPTEPAAPQAAIAPAIVIDKLPVSVQKFDEFLSEFVQPYIDLSSKIDPLVAEQASFVKQAFDEQRKFLLLVSKSKKPAIPSPAFEEALKPINKAIEKVISIKDSNRTSKVFNHLSAVADGIPALGWILVPTPVSYIPDFKDSAMFYSNRVIKEFKESDPEQAEWAKKFLNIFSGLQAYVKEYHTTGPSWNANGIELSDALKSDSESQASSSSSAAPPPPPPAAGGAPAPPPPPPMPAADVFKVDSDTKHAGSEGGMNAVFAALNKGSEITAGLKKVDKSQMTHKNPALRAQSVVPAKVKNTPVPPKKPSALTNKKPARKELVDSKWIIENFDGDQEVVIEGEINHGVFIDKCVNSTITIKGKVNAVSISECSKIGVVVDSLVSSIDVIKCKSFGVQITGKAPTISIDQSDSGSVYVGKDSLDIEVYTSQSTSLNLNFPENGDGDFVEYPVPEQLVHRFDPKGKLNSSIVEHFG